MSSKIALVTGSTSGIGLGIAKKMASDGHHVILNGLSTSPQDVEQIIQDIRTFSQGEILFLESDMSDVTQIEKLVENIQDKFGGIDILINNAGIQFVSPIEDFPPAKWDQILAINLSAAFHLTRLCVPYMKEKNWGRIINIASAHALVASPFKSAYVAAKHGIAGLTKTVALEVARNGITCNAICPGYVLTPLVEGQIDATALARQISRESVITDVLLGAQPTKQFVKVEEIANFAAFLCSENANSLTGAVMPMDGGWTAQ